MFKLSSEASLDGSVTVENKFIVEYMPYADGDYVKVYLYGLSLAARKSDPDDTVSRLARRLDLDAATVDAAIDYWTELGLMSRLGDDISYMSLRSVRPKIKKFDVDKYREFNIQAQRYISGRQIPPNEYNEYYSIMERLNIEWQAMTLIVKYCVDLKGDNVSCPYILAVARNLAQDGYRTENEVGDRLEEYGVYYNDILAVLGAMPGGSKRPDHEAVGLYKKWRKEYKFDAELILRVASGIKRGGMATLDAKLGGYRELGLNTVELIDKFEADRAAMYKLAKSINKTLGLYYDNVDPEISEYIRPWLGMGFEPNALVAIAAHCMRSGHKTLADLDAFVREFLAASATTEKQAEALIAHGGRLDGEIESLMRKLGIKGAVQTVYRAFYETWREKWSMPKDVIDYCATLAAAKTNPFSYMNKVLSAWHDRGVATVEAAKSDGAPDKYAAQESAPTVREKLTADQLNALVIALDEEA